MVKRYVFWRQPDGKPYKRDDDKHAPTALLAEIGRSASVESGGISWPLHPITVLREACLGPAAAVLAPDGEELNDADAWTVLWTAVVTIIKKQGGGSPVLPSVVLAEADRGAAAYFRKRPTDFVMVTSLSISEFPAKRIRIGNCEVSPLKARGRRFPYPDVVKSHASGTPFARHLKSSDYRLVKVMTDGRSVSEAIDKALDAINLLRGLWTLAVTHGAWSMSRGSMKQRPIGVVRIGPIRTLHEPDGTPIEHLYWFDPHYMGDQKLFEPKKGWERIETQRRKDMRRLKTLPYGMDVVRLIVRYVEALDHPDFDVAFQQMWGILEKLTDTVGARYDETVRRATAIFQDRGTAKEMLESLRLCRNRYVHAGHSVEEPEQIVYMVKRFVEPHLFRLIDNTFDIASLEEYAEYLSITRDAKTLDKRLRQLSKVRRMLKK